MEGGAMTATESTGEWLTEKRKKAPFEALIKVKSGLMILGFITQLLTFGQSDIARICLPAKVLDIMLPCASNSDHSSTEGHHRRLLWYDHRFLAAGGYAPNCKAIRGWKEWEKETSSTDYEFSNDPARFRLTHQTSFVRAHTSFWTMIPFFFYIGCFFQQFFKSLSKADYLTLHNGFIAGCFFQQFFKSVRRADYLTLRNGFIAVHLAPGSKFNFQKYIKRSLEDDFKQVIGVSPVLWGSFVVNLLLHVNGWQALFWASLIPVIIILAVGTKLQAILTRMALEISERHAVVQGIPLVHGSDKNFWFGRPHILHLTHFVLFQSYIASICLPAKVLDNILPCASKMISMIINKIIRTGRDFFRLPESERLKSCSDDPSKNTRGLILKIAD